MKPEFSVWKHCGNNIFTCRNARIILSRNDRYHPIRKSVFQHGFTLDSITFLLLYQTRFYIPRKIHVKNLRRKSKNCQENECSHTEYYNQLWALADTSASTVMEFYPFRRNSENPQIKILFSVIMRNQFFSRASYFHDFASAKCSKGL